MLRRSSGTKVHTPMGSEPLCGGSPCNFVPDLKSLGHDVAVHGGRKPVASWAAMLGEQSIRGEEALRVTRRLEPLQAPLPLAGRLLRMLRAMIERAMLPRFPPRENRPLRRAVALQLIRHDDTRNLWAPFEELAEASLRRMRVAPTLPQNLEHVPVLIHGPP
jgi:hypothetical protein